MSESSRCTLVLVHGAGHTADVWRAVQDQLRHPSLALDLPGRRNRPGDVTAITIEEAAATAAADVGQATRGSVILVGHSAGGIVLPALAASLDGRVDKLVFVAGLSAPHGSAVIDTVRPGQRAQTSARLAELRERYRGHMLHPEGLDHDAPSIDDAKLAMAIESLNFMSQTVSWEGVSPSLERIFVRCLRDPIQSPKLQTLLIRNCQASSIVDVDSGHTPAVDAPAETPTLLDRIADEARS